MSRITNGKDEMRQRKLVIAGSCIAIIVLLIIIYGGGVLYYKNHFYNNTYINGVKCSNKSVEKVQQLMEDQVNRYNLIISGRNNIAEQIAGPEFELKMILGTNLDELKAKQSPYMWFVNCFKKNNLENTVNWTYNEELLKSRISRLDFLKQENMIQPVNAKISEYGEGGYQVIKEEEGALIDTDKLYQVVIEAVEKLDETVSLEEANCYVDPTIRSDAKILQDAITKANLYTSTMLTYHFGDITEILDGDMISKWITFDENCNVILNEGDKGVKTFVNYIGKNYDTFGKKRTLKTSYGKTIEISGGDYGWWLNRDAEKLEIIEAIMNGEQKVKEPVYYQKAAQYGNDDIGNTYVEINLKAQHLFFYKDGQLVVESDLVSGNVSNGNATPTGTYPVQYKKKDAVLNGEDYSTPVKYWMPFNRNIGMHDANWRDNFGGNIYKTQGSHGCINLPPAAAKKIFDNIEKGVAVFCYEL